MDTKVVNIGSGYRSNPTKTHGKGEDLIRATQPSLHVRANVGSLIPIAYSNIDKSRLAKHSKLGAKVLSELAGSDSIEGESITITLPTDPNTVSADGLHYVLNAINRSNPERRLTLRLGEDLIFALGIWAAVKVLDLTTSQGRYRHDLLNKLSRTVPDAEVLKKAYLLHVTDPGVYGRALTCTAEHFINGTIDSVTVEQYLGVTTECMLSRDLKACINNVKRRAEDIAASQRNTSHQEKMWQLKNGLRTVSEREVQDLIRRNKHY